MDSNQSQLELSQHLAGNNHPPGYISHIFQPKMDWEYTMRREMQEIVPNVYLGPLASAMKSRLDVLQSEGISHIVCIRQALETHFIRPNFPSHFKYLVLEISDSPVESIIHHFKKANQFINDAIQQGGKVLVHGNGGNCRSAAIVTAYIMTQYGLSYSDALAVVRSHRFCICVSEGFVQQLMEYEYIYKAQQQYHCEENTGPWKRKRESETEEELISYPTVTLHQPDQAVFMQ